MERLTNIYTPLGIGSGSLIAGRYEIDIKLGAGATSAVYRARDKALNNTICAIKIIDTKDLSSPSDLERFRNEVLVTRKLTHPNIVRTFEFGETNSGQFFITMEYIEGRSLESLVIKTKESGLISIAEIVYYLKEIAAGLASAHQAKIVHRDLKPANVLVSRDGEVKITDFGLAKQKELDLKLTNEGECVGTPAYMSPEQLQGYDVDHRSDIFSFGILAYELLTGKLPFTGADWFSLGKSIVTDPLPEISAQKNKVPSWLCDLIRACASKDPDHRPQDFSEIIETLEKAELGEKDHLTRITEIAFGRKIPNIDIVKFAPVVIMVCLAIIIIMLVIESGKKSAEDINKKVVTSQGKINDIVNNMNKAITVLQKLDQNAEVIDKVYEKIAEEESEKQKKLVQDTIVQEQISDTHLQQQAQEELKLEEELLLNNNLEREQNSDFSSPRQKRTNQNNNIKKIRRPIPPKRVISLKPQ